MLFYYLYYVKYFCSGMIIISLLATACALYAYSVDSHRADDDPDKKNYRPEALLLVPFFWPVLLVALISLFVLRVLFYGIFLSFFIIFLILFPREAPGSTWPEKATAKIGALFLKANTFLLELFLRPRAEEPETI